MPQPRNPAPKGPPIRKGREGARWYNARPTAEEFADWFRTVPLHADLEHSSYVGGIVLIQQKEKTKEVRDFNPSSGLPIIGEVEHLVYSPHPNVSTRVRYFQDYLAVTDFDGILDVDVPRGGPELGLPSGFFKYSAANADGKAVNFVGYSVRVKIFRPKTMCFVDVREGNKKQGLIQTRRVEGDLIFEGAPGTKIVPVSGRWGADENALMKAQSGAVGRALGLAGMLVIPGSGIATSEDMNEALSGENAGIPTPTLPEPVSAASPGVRTPIDDPAANLAALEEDLESLSGDAFAAYLSWVAQRELKDTPGDIVTRTRQLERKIDELTRGAS